MLNLAVLVSGNGSNLKAIQRSIQDGQLNARIVVAVGSSAGIPALDFAASAGLTTSHLPPSADLAEQEKFLLQLFKEHGVDFIALAGYLKLLPQGVVDAYRARIVNIHPALLPSFGGKGMYGHHVHEAVIANGAEISGATVHIVDEEFDRGAIVLQRTVEIADEETADSLAAKVLAIEHVLYSEVLQLFAEGRVSVTGNEATIT